MFAGPTLTGTEALRRIPELPVRCLPPARRGDIEDLVSRVAPGNVAIVDGTFQMFPAVGHAELRAALRRGWRVWGLASLGAIRACEMRDLGMRGYGKVFERFVQEDGFSDDEVALLHGAESPYRPMTEPLIHMREAVEHLVERIVISRGDADEIVGSLASMWFGDRTLALLASLVRRRRPDVDANLINEWIRDFDRFRLKSLDLLSFLVERPWQTSS
jgi:hypothetical protein